MKQERFTWILCLILLVLGIVSLLIGAVDINFDQSFDFNIFILSRIPRLLAILCTGIGMSVAGLVMQRLCNNKFVSPTTSATIQSAQLGIALAMIFFPTMGLKIKTLFAFLCSMIATLGFIVFSQKIKVKDPILVPLIGIMFGNIIGGITNFIAYEAEITQQLSTYFSGSFALIMQGNYELVYLTLPLVILAFVYANHFNIVAMGKDFSKNLGLNYHLVLIIGLIIASTICASVVVVVGQISYIGLIIPNIVSILKGDRLKGTLIDTALCGAIFVLGCDIIARTIVSPYEIPIDMIVGIIGSLLFIFIIYYQLKEKSYGYCKTKK